MDLDWYYNLRHTNPVTPEVLEEAYKNGMIRKEDLEDGAYYLGACRNGSVAQWIAKKNLFVYMRHKFNDIFVDEIEHPADDQGTDFFIPMKKIETKTVDILEP